MLLSNTDNSVKPIYPRFVVIWLVSSLDDGPNGPIVLGRGPIDAD